MAYQSIFKRVEKKYLLDEKTYKQLILRLEEYVVPDEYGESTICNVYYDTPDSRLIRQSLEKPVYKEKFRVRSYGTATSDSTVFVELKKKYKGVVYKRRVGMKLKKAEQFIEQGVSAGKNKQIENELRYFLDYYKGIAPAMFLSYERTAFYSKNDPELRITFDKNIIYRQEEMSLDKGVWGTHLLKKGERVLEIKVPGSMPKWLSQILDELEIYPTSFSKYGKAYAEVTSENFNKGKVNYCA